MAKKEGEGYVYILTNLAMPKLVKIGRTKRAPKERAAQLYTTGVPLPFEVHAALKVRNPRLIEKRLHKRFERQRVNPKREFFKVRPRIAHAALYEVAGRRSQSERFLTTVVVLLVVAISLGAYLSS